MPPALSGSEQEGQLPAAPHCIHPSLQEIKANCLLSNVKLKFENFRRSMRKRMLEGSGPIKKNIAEIMAMI